MEESEYPTTLEDLQKDLTKLRTELSSMYADYEFMKKNPKIYKRKLQLLGSKITKANYTIANRMIEIENAIASAKRE